jgi:hypothetical protein
MRKTLRHELGVKRTFFSYFFDDLVTKADAVATDQKVEGEAIGRDQNVHLMLLQTAEGALHAPECESPLQGIAGI